MINYTLELVLVTSVVSENWLSNIYPSTVFREISLKSKTYPKTSVLLNAAVCYEGRKRMRRVDVTLQSPVDDMV